MTKTDEKVIVNEALDLPDARDYTFEEFVKLKVEKEDAEASAIDIKRPKDEVEVQDQGQTPACTVFGANHIHNGLNILEDRRYGKSRLQSNSAERRIAFCKDRGYSAGGSSIQTVSDWFKKKNYIAGYVSIPKNTPLDKTVLQMKQAIDMGMFIYGGSARGNWSKIRKTGIYEDSDPQYFLGHGYGVATSYELKDNGEVDFFRAINSYGDKRGPYNGYFKIYTKDVCKLYTKIVFVDYDDKDIFAKLQEVEKIKQAVKLIREVYLIADKPVKDYLDSIQVGKTFSTLYNTTI